MCQRVVFLPVRAPNGVASFPQVLEVMAAGGGAPDAATLGALAKGWALAGDPANAWAVLDEGRAAGLAPGAAAYASLVSGLCRVRHSIAVAGSHARCGLQMPPPPLTRTHTHPAPLGGLHISLAPKAAFVATCD